MKYKKGIDFIFAGLLAGSFIQAVTVGDTLLMGKIVGHILAGVVTTLGCILIIKSQSDEKKKVRLAWTLVSFIAIYCVGITLVYWVFQGIISSIVAIVVYTILSRRNILLKYLNSIA